MGNYLKLAMTEEVCGDQLSVSGRVLYTYDTEDTLHQILCPSVLPNRHDGFHIERLITARC